jgi:N-hydroxyarylamine O-acetyltransferase
VFDLDSYLERIGLQEREPSPAELHRAHVTSIPFESLDPHCGVAVSLQEEDLAAKLVRARRGGYCFEQNLLLSHALQALGARVQLYLARVLIGADPALPRARSHLVLGVEWQGQKLHADAGLGGGTLLEPLPWGPGDEHVQAGWRYRIREREPEYVLQRAGEDGAWGDLYSLLPFPVPQVDVETANWWTATNPGSRFVSGFLISRQWPDGRGLVMSDWGELALVETSPARQRAQPIDRARLPEVLAERFELPGFVLEESGRLARAQRPRR